MMRAQNNRSFKFIPLDTVSKNNFLHHTNLVHILFHPIPGGEPLSKLDLFALFSGFCSF